MDADRQVPLPLFDADGATGKPAGGATDQGTGPADPSGLQPGSDAGSAAILDETGAAGGEASFLRPTEVRRAPVAEFADVATLDDLRRIAAACTRCRLRPGCQQVVFGEGNPRARLMFVGEGPGEQEDRLGRPFVGRAGQLLDRMIEAIGLVRTDVYIANVVKCRPPGNRAPLPDEAAACWPYLRRQIELIRPEIIVCLGATAARQLVDSKASVQRMRGRWFERNGRRYLITFHPAALLRTPAHKRLAWDDLKMVQEVYTNPA